MYRLASCALRTVGGPKAAASQAASLGAVLRGGFCQEAKQGLVMRHTCDAGARSFHSAAPLWSQDPNASAESSGAGSPIAGQMGSSPVPPSIDAPSSASTAAADAVGAATQGAGERRVKIYTKTGDKGTSGLFTGERRAKDDQIFEALGATDELTSSLAVARQYCTEVSNGLEDRLEWIQCVLQDVGSCIATPRSTASAPHKERVQFDASQIDQLEKWIDRLDDDLPPLRNFILPSGGRASSFLHVSRSLCRRAERRVVPLVRDGNVDEAVGRYLNRLSDFLFTAARFAAKFENKPELIFKSRSKKVEQRQV